MTIDEIDELLRQHPGLKQICDGKAQYSLALTRLVFERSAAARQERLQEIEESLSYLKSAEDKYCIEHGIPLDYANPVFSCSLCEDRGWIAYDTRTGVLEPCRCSLDRRHKRIFRLSGLSDQERLKTFGTFDTSYYGDAADQERAKRVHARCRKFASEVVAGRSVNMGIGVVGNVGRGKTHLLLAIFNHVVEASPRLSPIYCVAADLFDELRSGYEDGAEVSYNERVRTLVDADLLILDDLGSEKWTGWVENTLFKIVNGRLIRNKPLAFSTNLQMEDLCSVVGERIFSRIYSSCEILPLLGKDDIRLRRKFESLNGRSE